MFEYSFRSLWPPLQESELKLPLGACKMQKHAEIANIGIFRWFKFTLKPPYRIAIGNFFSAIWDTSHWNFLVKFGLKTAWDMSYDILLSLLKFVNFWRLQGHLSILAKIGCLQKIKVFLMKERQGFDATWGGFR